MKTEFKNNFFICIFFLTCLAVFLRLKIINEPNSIAPFVDDFYYYLVTAKNSLKYGFPTFDTFHITNGYQPLWFLIILFAVFIFKTGITFNAFIISVIFLFSFFSFYNFKKFLKSEKYTEIDSVFISSFASYLTLFFSKGGMEVSMAIFFLSLSLVYLKKNFYFFSFFSFLSFLSRIDIIFIILIFIFNHFLEEKNKFKIENLKKYFLLPFLIFFYVLINYYFFGSLFPESGTAKSLFKNLRFNFITFSFFLENGFGFLLIKMLFIINILGLLLLLCKNKGKIFLIALSSFFLFFCAQSLRSPWPLWNWHFYYLAFTTPIILNELLKFFIKKNLKFYPFFFISLFFLISSIFVYYNDLNSKNDHILNIAYKIKKYYSDKKDKIFAMGDMAGKISFLLDKPILQLEGLVSGKKILQNIRDQNNLCNILKKYKVEVYFTNQIVKSGNNYIVYEPSIPSSNAKKMSGVFLNKPEKIFKSEDLYVYAFNLNKKNKCVKKLE